MSDFASRSVPPNAKTDPGPTPASTCIGDEHLEKETSLGSATISISLRRAIKKEIETRS